MSIEFAVHYQHIVALGFGCRDITILLLKICSIEIDKFLVLVCLYGLDELAVLVKRVIFAVLGFEKSEFHRTLAEFLVAEHAIFDKELDIVPLFLEIFPLRAENLFETVCNLFGYVSRYFLDIGIAL